MVSGTMFSSLRLLALATPVLLALPAAAQDPDNATLGIGATPDAEPNQGISVMVGGGAGVVPTYEGSKQFKAVPLPLIDIRGLADDRIFISSLRGIGVNVIDWGDLRAGVAIGYHGGRAVEQRQRQAPRPVRHQRRRRCHGLPDLFAETARLRAERAEHLRITDHWGLAAHAGLTELVGDTARHSPLTERDIQPSAFLGLTYRF